MLNGATVHGIAMIGFDGINQGFGDEEKETDGDVTHNFQTDEYFASVTKYTTNLRITIKLTIICPILISSSK